MSRTAETPTGQAPKKSSIRHTVEKLALELIIPIVAFKVLEELAPLAVRLSHPESNPKNNKALMTEIDGVGAEFDAFTQQSDEQQKAHAGHLAEGLKNAAVTRLQELGFDDPADADLIARAVAKDQHSKHLEETGLRVLVRNRLNNANVLDNDVNTPDHATELHTRSGHAVELGNTALNFLTHGNRRLSHDSISAEVMRRQIEDTVQLTARAMKINAQPIANGDQRTLGEVLTKAESSFVEHAGNRKARNRVKDIIKRLSSEQKAGLNGVALTMAAVNALTTENPLSREAQALVYLSERIGAKEAGLASQAEQQTQEPPQE